jgi:hypothetical protein
VDSAASVFSAVAAFAIAEVEELRRSVCRDDDIRRLQIAMDDAGRVRGTKRFADVGGVLECRSQRHCAVTDHVCQRRPSDQLHHQSSVIADIDHVVERRDVWMIERRQRLRFAVKARQQVGVVVA